MGYRTTKSKVKAEGNKAKTFNVTNASTDISYTTFFYYAFRNVLLVSVPLLIFSINPIPF